MQRSAITVVCGNDLVTGFKLAGVDAVGADTAAQAGTIVRQFHDSGKWGIVLISDALAGALSGAEQARMEKSASPVFIRAPIAVVPDQDDDQMAVNIVETMVQQAIGRRISITPC